MKNILLFFVLSISLSTLGQSAAAWKAVTNDEVETTLKIREREYAQRQQLFSLDEAFFRQSLTQVQYQAPNANGTIIKIPSIAKGEEQFLIWETSNFAPGLRARFPEIKSYVGKGLTDPTAYIRFSVSPLGVQTMVLRADGAEFIEPYTTDRSVYVLFDSETRIKNTLPLHCTTADHIVHQEVLNRIANAPLANNQIFRTYRLALSCTGEYGAYFGGTVANALAAMNQTMDRVNGIMDVDLAVKLEIIDNNDLVVYTSGASDPYSSAALGSAGAWNAELQNNLTAVLGNAAYDIGHLFGRSGGGGNAGCIGCVCVDDTPSTTDTNKGSAFTSPADGIPQGDGFDIDYVIHEMGHQLGAFHTFSFNVEGTGVNIEPGSGITIMGYAGVTGTYDIAQNSLPFYAYRSIQQIQNNLTGTCSSNVTLSNNPPVVDAGQTVTIPISTPYVLRGTASDPNGDAITLVWEQNDNAPSSQAGNNSFPSPTKTQGPNYRSFSPTASPDRFMPTYSTVLSGALSNTWEATSSVSRQLKFTLTGRDNVPGAGQTSTDSKTVNVSSSAGPFAVTSQNTSGISWQAGATETITWSVNNTTSLAGSANVNIKLSVDGGLTFPITLAANTPNDGTQDITVPAVSGQNCRIWIEPTGNIYYAINSTPFAIGFDCNSVTINPNVAIPDGAGNNQAGTTLTSTISVTEAGTINGMTVNIASNHTWIGDMVIRITHPDGTQRTLWNRQCNSAQNSGLNVTFQDGSGAVVCGSPTNGTYNPNQTLAAFNGKPTQGTWTLSIQDFFAQDTGNLLTWGVNFGCTLSQTSFNAVSDFSIYPNPSKGTFTIACSAAQPGTVKISVHDLRGRHIFENSFLNTGVFNQEIDLNNTESGIYLVTVMQGDLKAVKRVVIE